MQHHPFVHPFRGRALAVGVFFRLLHGEQGRAGECSDTLIRRAAFYRRRIIWTKHPDVAGAINIFTNRLLFSPLMHHHLARPVFEPVLESRCRMPSGDLQDVPMQTACADADAALCVSESLSMAVKECICITYAPSLHQDWTIHV